ncbi:MAG: rhodanese-like domain-containing protein [Gammaproteobacteria bacterium]
MNLALHTLGLAGSETLNDGFAAILLAGGCQLVDVRSAGEFMRDALPGALNLPVEALSYDFRHLDKHEPVIVYGAHPVACVRAARLLAGQGFSRIYHLAFTDTAGTGA